MPNITEVELIQSLGTNFTAIRGYDLVVYKRGKYHTTLLSGERYLKDWKDRMGLNTYQVYAVNNANSNSYKFRKSYIHNDNVHEFHLNYALFYKVSNSKTLVDKLYQDPLKKLKREISRLIGGYIKDSDWQSIVEMNNFRRLRERALTDLVKTTDGESQSNQERLQKFADSLGLELLELEIERDVIEKYIKGKLQGKDIEVEDYQNQLKINQTRQSESVRKEERITETNDNLHRAANNSIRVVASNISGGIEDIDELVDAIGRTKKIRDILHGGNRESKIDDLIKKGTELQHILSSLQEEVGLFGFNKSDFDFSKYNMPQQGNISYEVPLYMKTRNIHKAVVRIAKTNLDENSLKIKTTSVVESLSVGNTMSVRIIESNTRKQNFIIKSISTPKQAILDEQFTEWSFNIEPLNQGKHFIIINVSLANSKGDIIKDIKNIELEIDVKGEDASYKEEIQILIANDKLSDAIDELLKYFKEDTVLLRELIVISRQFSQLEHGVRCSLLSFDDSFLKKNQIGYSLLMITDKLH